MTKAELSIFGYPPRENSFTMHFFNASTKQFVRRGARSQRVIKSVVALLLIAAPVFAQVGGGGSPFDSTLNALLSFAQGTFAKIAAILAVIFGGWQMVGGDGHGKRALGG